MTKNEEKKCDLKNDKVEHVLFYHFLNDENHTQTVSPGKKKLIWPHGENGSSFCSALYLCILEGKKLELTIYRLN